MFAEIIMINSEIDRAQNAENVLKYVSDTKIRSVTTMLLLRGEHKQEAIKRYQQ